MAIQRSTPAVRVALVVFLIIWGLTTHGKYSSSGDEPHYLITTRSLAVDHDLDLANNYAANDGRLIGNDGLVAGPHARTARDGRLQSTHDIGLPILLVPVYAVAAGIAAHVPQTVIDRFRMSRGLLVYSLISLSILALTCASVAVLIAGLTYVVDTRTAVVVGTIVTLSPPILTLSFLVFPEAIAFAVACAVVWWTLNPSPPERATWLLVAALGLLPWCHRKYSVFVIACALMMLIARWPQWQQWTRKKQLVAMCLFVVPHALFHVWTISTWGTIGGPHVAGGAPFTLSGSVRGFIGIWLDRQSGLAAYSPIYLLLPACWIVGWRRARWAALPVISLLVPVSAFIDWWGGFSPAARYMVPAMPFVAWVVALAVRNRPIALAGALLLLPQAVIFAVGWQHPRTLWPIDDLNPLLNQLGPMGRAYEHALPSLRNGPLPHGMTVWLVALALNLAIVAIGSRDGLYGRPRGGELM